jgi:hypothetical protein
MYALSVMRDNEQNKAKGVLNISLNRTVILNYIKNHGKKII